MKIKSKNRPSRKSLLIIIDFIIFATVYLGMAFCYVLGGKQMTNFQMISILIMIVFAFILRLVLGVYSGIWRFANSAVYLKLVIADGAATVPSYFVSYLIYMFCVFFKMPYIPGEPNFLFFACYASIALILTLGSRFSYQVVSAMSDGNVRGDPDDSSKIGVAIVGAGQTGSMIASELMYKSSSRYRPVCFVDNDPDKVGKKLLGIKVLPADDDIISRLKSLPVQEVFIALHELSSEKLNDLHELYGPHFKIKLYDFPIRDGSGPSDKRVIREVRIEDLLLRDTLDLSSHISSDFYRDKVVLVTGGGGSIGSEICRQVAHCHPKQLIILDIYENNAYEIEQHFSRKYGNTLNYVVEIASVRDRERLDAIFAHYKPDIVFHAAAHKHVPLMEHSSCEAIKNNILGTYNTADMAEKHGASKFVLISTDKAVNPTNIMGASKRMCEMIVQCRNDSKTAFSAVRFGNVLGSNGSVIPLFKKQIARGGPITITDKRIIRYFMTIPEASQLVLQAGAMAKKGELFVLNMGKPVKILDLAENMIKLSGLTPYIDIDIVEIGLRPGEKLYEELLMQSETLSATDNNLIFIEKDTPFSRAEIDNKLALLKSALEECAGGFAPEKIKAAMHEVVSTYKEPDEVNLKAEEAVEMKQTNSQPTSAFSYDAV